MLSAWHMTPETAADGEEALAKLATFPADVILTDLNMPGMDGFGLLQQLRDAGDSTPTIVITAFGNIEKAVQTVHELGAYWFLDKPIQPSVLEVLIRRAGSHAGLLADKRNLERQLSYKGSLGQLVGTSPKMQEIFSLLQQAAPSKACVLITGESGTGKELVARTVHALSPRRQGPVHRHQLRRSARDPHRERTFRAREGLLHGSQRARVRAASKWRSTAHCCWMKSARCPCRRRPSCCAFWKIRTCAAWAESTSSKSMCAWWRPPTKCPKRRLAAAILREDLFYRLNVFHVHIPPLRDRKADIPALAEALMADMNRKHDCRVTEISLAALGGFRAA